MVQRTRLDCDTGSLPSLPPAAQRVLARVAFWSACGSAVAILFSIAVSQSLLGIAIATFLLSGSRVRAPRAALPLLLFLVGTIISILLSGDPRIGMPQVRKLYVYLTILVIFSVVRHIGTARNLLLAWCAAASVGSVFGVVQFVEKWQEARELHRNFYTYYLQSRITGFMSHWMTFSGEQMLVLIILAAFLLFGRIPGQRWTAAWIAAGCAMGAALLLSDTRSVWIGAFTALVYLAWSRKKALALAIPLLACIALALAPSSIRDRAVSIVKPHGDVDSNGFRVVVWRTGLRMIAAHPFWGLGPEEVHAQFYDWIPADIARPLPSGYYGHLHSIYIHYAAERGIPTMLMLVWMLGMIVYDSSRALRRVPAGRGDARFILHAAVACVLAIAVEGVAELNLGDSEVLTMFLVLTACAYVAVEQTRRPNGYAAVAEAM